MKAAQAPPAGSGRGERLGLTVREGEVVELLADGLTNGEIATSLEVSPRTVQRHLENVYDKLDVRTRAGAVGKVLRG